VRYQEYSPGARLARWVHCYWVLEASQGAADVIVPDGRMELVFHYGEPFRRVYPDGRAERQPRSFLVGQHRRAIGLEPPGRVGVFGVRFRPGGAWPFLGFPQQEVADRMTALQDLWGRLGREIQEEVAEAGGAAGRVAAVEAFLCGRLRGGTPRMVEAVVQYILESAGRVQVGDLAKECGVSSRQLSKSFRTMVGISPKTLGRLVRFQRALRLAGRLRWAELAAECGFYDQAHLIREFHEIAGQTPVLRLAESHPLGDWFVDGSGFSNTGQPDSAILGP
jgi:AraC-like DNA-binding protein